VNPFSKNNYSLYDSINQIPSIKNEMMKNPKPLPQSATPTEQQSLDAIEQLKDTLTDMAKLRRSLRSLQEGGFRLMPDTRRLKVQPVFRETQADPYNFHPGIDLCGRWLSNAGFECEQHVNVIALHRLLIIFPENALPEPGRLRKLA
jgi:hypothetical protein